MPHEVEVRTDNRLTTSGSDAATPDDAMALHEWPEEVPQADEPVTVAIMDSGIHPKAAEQHPWFMRAEVTKRYDATGAGSGGDKVGHGTGCASIFGTAAASYVAALTGDPVPVEFYDVRIFGDSGRTSFPVIRDAYEWLIDHAGEIDVVNMSWGARQDVPQINQLHEKLIRAGVHDVVAAGNTGSEGGSPATSPQAFSAGAVDKNGDLTRFTSRDPNQDNPDVAALGKDVKMARAPGTSMGTPINSKFTKASGTSFAAPYTGAAYVVALYRERASWDSTFEETAEDIPGTRADGEGLLKVAPSLDGDGPEPPQEPPEDRPLASTGATVFPGVGGFQGAILNSSWIPADATRADLLEESDGSATVRYSE